MFACEDKEQDCAGVEGGTATVDNCDQCVGGTTDKVACNQDCAGVWGGNNICGCTDSTVVNYNSEASYDDSSCVIDLDNDGYDDRDIQFLQKLIDNSFETINWDLDTDNSGLIEPLELGNQEWVDGRITELDCYLNYNSGHFCEISGSIPPEIGDLTNLTSLSLWNNQLTGSIPSEIGNLTELWFLYLLNNQFTSVPSSIGNLINLEVLNLSANPLISLPESIGNLTNLIFLYLYGNQLESVPSSIGNLTNLYYLDLNFNQLTSLPESIGNLTNLVTLYLQSNQLTSLPESISNLTSLAGLDLLFNFLYCENGEQNTDLIPQTVIDFCSQFSLYGGLYYGQNCSE